MTYFILGSHGNGMMIIAFDHFVDAPGKLLDRLGNVLCQKYGHASAQHKSYAIEQQEILESFLYFS